MTAADHQGLYSPAQHGFRGTPRTLSSQPLGHTQGNPLATPTPHHPQPWMKTRTALPPQTQALTPRHRPRPFQDRQTQRRRHPARRPPTCQRLRHGAACTTDIPPAVLHEERAKGAAGGAHVPQPAAAEEGVLPGTATSPARVGTHDNRPPRAPETEDILWSIYNKLAPTAYQGPQTDEHLHPMSPSPRPWRPAGRWLHHGAVYHIGAAAHGAQHGAH